MISFGQGAIAQIPYITILVLIIALVAEIVLRWTSSGFRLLAIGSDPQAAHLVGFHVERTRMLLLVFSGFIAGVSGVCSIAYLDTASPTAGTGYELTVLAAVIIGGVKLTGGRGSILGILLGLCVIGIFQNFIVLWGVSPNWTQGVSGLVLIAAMTGRPVGARARADWKAWVSQFYKKPIKMAVSCAGTSNPYFAPTNAGAEDAGAQLGIDMLWTGVPDGNTVNQIAQFQQLVNTGYEAIAVVSFEPDAWIAPIKKAMEAGVLVLTSNNDSPNSGRELYFGQDLVGAAVVQGQLLAKLAGNKGKVAMTNCAPGSLALDLRIKGAREGVTKGG